MRHAVLFIRQQQTVPMDGGFFVPELVVHADAGKVAFTEAQGGAWNATIDGQSTNGCASGIYDLPGNEEVVFDQRPAGRLLFTGVAGRCCRVQSQHGQKEKGFHEIGES